MQCGGVEQNQILLCQTLFVAGEGGRRKRCGGGSHAASRILTGASARWPLLCRRGRGLLRDNLLVANHCHAPSPTTGRSSSTNITRGGHRIPRAQNHPRSDARPPRSPRLSTQVSQQPARPLCPSDEPACRCRFLPNVFSNGFRDFMVKLKAKMSKAKIG